MAPHWPCGSPLSTQLAYSGQKMHLDVHPSRTTQVYYRQGHPADLANKTKLPYALPRHNAVPDAEWQHTVEWFSHARYLQDMEIVNAERTWSGIDAFYTTMNQTNPIKAARKKLSKQIHQLSKQWLQRALPLAFALLTSPQ